MGTVTQVVDSINKSLTDLEITDVVFSALNGTVTISINGDYSVYFTKRLTMIFGFDFSKIVSTTTARSQFQPERPFQTVRLLSNVSEAICGELNPSPILCFRPESMKIFERLILPRYLKVSSVLNRMIFNLIDISGESIPLAKSADTPYILLHFMSQ